MIRETMNFSRVLSNEEMHKNMLDLYNKCTHIYSVEDTLKNTKEINLYEIKRDDGKRFIVTNKTKKVNIEKWLEGREADVIIWYNQIENGKDYEWEQICSFDIKEVEDG